MNQSFNNEETQKLVHKALQHAYFYLKFRSRTKKELERYLHKKAQKNSFTPEVIALTLQELEQHNLINDKEFVQRYVESRSTRNPKGEIVLRNELIKLGISKELLDEHFSLHPIDQSATAMLALEKKWDKYTSLEPRKRFEKAAQFLARRGFSFDIIKKTIAELEKTE